jgi:SPP1 gp7 family putative phage head morphogenesis protein
MAESVAQELIEHQFDVLSFSGRVSNLLWTALQRARDELSKTLETSSPKAEFTRTHQQILLAQVDGLLLRAADNYGRELDPAARAVIIEEFRKTTAALFAEAERKLPDPPPVLPVQTVRQLANKPIGGRVLKTWIDRHFRGLKTQLREELAQSILQTETLDQARRRLQNAFGLSRHGATTLAHTALLSAAHEARQEVYRQNKELIVKFRYLSTLDRRTCPRCFPYDGREAESIEGLPPVPQHARCRCIIIPVTSLARPTTRPAVLETESRTIRHRDGSTSTKHRPVKVEQVPSSLTYSQWFSRQRADWQRDVLGGERYRLWKSGKLALDDFTSGPLDARRIIPLEELHRRLKAEEN